MSAQLKNKHVIPNFKKEIKALRKKNKKKCILVIAHKRLGNHHYYAGVYTELSKAMLGSKQEEEYRGGKYFCLVVSCSLKEAQERLEKSKQW